MAARVDEITNALMIFGVTTTQELGALQLLDEHQSAITIGIMLITGIATIISVVYGIHHKRQLRILVAAHGIQAVRRGERP